MKQANTKEFNTCSGLMNDETFQQSLETYNSLLEEGIDPFQHMLQMQYDLQFALADKSPENNPKPNELNTLGQKFDWLRENKQAFDDEYSELVDALPGMSMEAKDRSAVCKLWKSNYNEVRSMTFNDLSEEDIKELKFEYIDALIFFMNMSFALDIDSREIFIYFYAKVAENHRRSKNGY